jgi:hypothetical protein
MLLWELRDGKVSRTTLYNSREAIEAVGLRQKLRLGRCRAGKQ